MSMLDDNWDKAKEILKCKVVLDMDDSWLLPSNHLNYQDYKEFTPRIENNIIKADLVTVTNENLADAVKKLNENVVILPNSLPYGYHQFTDERTEDERVRIFWAGGITHEGDLEILKNPIRRLVAYKNKIRMVLGGYTETDNVSKWIWDKMKGYFTSAGQLDYRIHKGTTPDKYMSMYNDADIMVIPLLKSDWSACKSNLKILEAASKGLPVVVSNVAPYNLDKDAPVFWVDKQTDWYKHLNFLINNKNAREDYGAKVKEWAARKYNFFAINEQRRWAFESIIRA
jgi:glycosyltransferase involved in cell wall biosynthesis